MHKEEDPRGDDDAVAAAAADPLAAVGVAVAAVGHVADVRHRECVTLGP